MLRSTRAVVALTSVLVLTGAATTAPPALAAAPGAERCTVRGTPGDDVLRGTAGDDVVCGYGGDDRLLGLGGDDLLLGGRGDDEVLGGDGDDLLSGGLGDDVLRGDGGADLLAGGRGDDVLVGGPGKDSLSGGRENDRVDGRDGSGVRDALGCGPGRDTATADASDGVRRTCERITQPTAPTSVALASSSVAENEAAGTQVGVLVVSDRDRGEQHALTLVPGPGSDDNGAFTLAGATLRTSRPLDHETEPTLDLRVRATDPEGLSVEQALRVTVTDRDEPASAEGDVATVEEDASATAVDVLANDRDAEGQAIAVTSATQPSGGTVVVAGDGTGLTYRPSPDACTPAGTTDTFTYTITGGSTATVAVTVTCTPDAPVLTTGAGAAAYDEDAGPTSVDPGLSLDDVDPGARVDGATVAISGHHAPGEDVLALAGTHPGITASWSAPTLTLSGSAPVAAYQAALRDVTYQNTSDAPSGLRRTLEFAVTGDDGLRAAGTKVLDVTPRNDAPVLTPATDSLTHTEGGSPTAVAGTLTVTDPDDAALVSAAVRIAAGHQAGDVLAGGGTAAVAATYDGAAGVLTLSPTGPTATAAQLQAALRTVTFSTGEDDPLAARTLEIVASDAEGPSAAATRAVAVTAVNDAPRVVVSAGTVTAAEDDPDGEVVDAALSVTDVDDTQLAGAVVTIDGAESGDRLAFVDQGPIAGAYDAAGATLTLTGTGSLAQYRDALRTVRFVVGGQDPGPAARTVTVTVTDGDDPSSASGRAVAVTAVNDAPTVTVPDALTLAEDTVLSLDGEDALTVADPDARGGGVRVTLTATHGSVTLGSTAGLTFTTGDGTADATTTFTGALAEVGTALAGTTFAPTSDHHGSASLQVTVDDRGNTGAGGAQSDTATTAITVTAVNDAPVLTAPASQSVAQSDTRTFGAATGNAITVFDVDAGSAGVRLRLEVGEGALTLAATTGLTFSTGDGTADPVLDLTGTVAALGAALDGLQYRPATGWHGTDTLDVDVDDLGNTGAGGARTAGRTVTLDVLESNTAPVNTVPGPQTVLEDDALTFAGPTRLAVSDADVDRTTGELEVELAVDHGVLTLAGTTGLDLTTGDGTGDVRVAFRGSPDAIDAALDGATYEPAPDYAGPDTLTMTTDDLGEAGSPGPLTDTDTVALSVTAVNDAPVLTQPTATALAYTEDVPSEDHADAVAPGLGVADADDAVLLGATVTLTAAAPGDQLAFVNQGGITGSYGAGTLTLSGSATTAAYQTALRSVRYLTTSEDPDETARTVAFRVDDGHASGNLSAPVTRTIDVVATNDAPSADDETFAGASRAIGNTSLVVDDPSDSAPDPAGPQKTVTGDLLDGATDAETPAAALTVTPTTKATANGGTVTLEADGDFTYLPPQGCAVSTDSFTYTVNDHDPAGNLTGTGTVSLAVADCVWYVDASLAADPATATGGTSQAPYKTLTALAGAGGTGDEDASGDRIFLYDGTYNGGLPLENGEQVLSERHGLAVPRGDGGTTTLHAPDAAASRSWVHGGTVLALSNLIQGVDFGALADGYALSGASVGSLTINTVTSGGVFNAVGGGVSITGAGNVLNVRLSGLTSAGAPGGLVLTDAAGTFTAGAGTISSPSGTPVSIVGGTADVTLDAEVRKDAGPLVSVQNATGGTKDFNGLVTDAPLNGNGGGVSLSGNTGATVRFDGGVRLSTGAAPAFSATGGGTVAVTDPATDGNVLITTTGTALAVANTAIHPDDLTFESISSAGAVNGVSLVSTGGSGGLAVTGAGGACTVDTPTCTGGTIQGSTGPGVRVEGAGGGVSLTRVRVTGGTGDGIRFAESTGLSVDSSLVTANGDSTTSDGTAAGRDRGLDVENGTGSIAVVSTQVSGSHFDNVRVDNDHGTVDLDLTGSTVAGAKQGDGVQLYGDGTATMKADVTGSTFTTNFDDALQLVTAAASPTMDLNLVSNQLSADATQVSAGALLTISPGGASATRVNVADNTLNTSKGSAMILNPAGTAQFDATVSANTILNAGGIGIWGKPAQAAQSRMRIVGNTVGEYRAQGMYLRHGEGVGGRADYVVQGNTLSTNVGQEGLFVEAGTTSSGSESVTVCADLGGSGALANALGNAGGPDGGGGSFDDVAFARYTNSFLVLPGYGGDPTAYVASRNTGNPFAFSWGPQEPTGGTSCLTPSLPPAP